jgi:hypothetical protein
MIKEYLIGEGIEDFVYDKDENNDKIIALIYELLEERMLKHYRGSINKWKLATKQK